MASDGFDGTFDGIPRCTVRSCTVVPLTDVTVRRAKGREAPYKLADGGGLYVLVRPNGGRYWRMDYRWAGRRRTIAFGVYPTVSLSDARDKRDQAKKLIAAGIDPGLQRKMDRLASATLPRTRFMRLRRNGLLSAPERGTPRQRSTKQSGCLSSRTPSLVSGRLPKSVPPSF